MPFFISQAYRAALAKVYGTYFAFKTGTASRTKFFFVLHQGSMAGRIFSPACRDLKD